MLKTKRIRHAEFISASPELSSYLSTCTRFKILKPVQEDEGSYCIECYRVRHAEFISASLELKILKAVQDDQGT